MEATKTINYEAIANDCSEWLKNYSNKASANGYVIGVSGGIDSAVASTLCAMTGLPVLCLEMPIHQGSEQVSRAKKHIDWLKGKFDNVTSKAVDLTESYDSFVRTLETTSDLPIPGDDNRFMVLANTRSRLRMVTLYANAQINRMLVCGTGNKVEDFGVGFYTKYGDGGVDISPIADLMKSEVYKLGAQLGVIQEILEARPTDGLWDDGRTDEDQIGATYDELEWAMQWTEASTVVEQGVGQYYDDKDDASLTERERDVLEIYWNRHNANRHKMVSIPVFKTDEYR
jgi:NAD+ synthase